MNLSLGTTNGRHAEVLQTAAREAAVAGVWVVAAGEQDGVRWLPGSLAAAVVWAVLDVGLLFDGKRAAVGLELARLGATSIAACWWASTATTGAGFAAVVIACLVVASASAAWLLALRRELLAAPRQTAPASPAAP